MKSVRFFLKEMLLFSIKLIKRDTKDIDKVTKDVTKCFVFK